MEFTPDVVEQLIAHSEKDLSQAKAYRFVETAETLRTHDYSEMNKALFIFLDKLEAHFLSVKAATKR
jgi:GMP synthase (glutamine-hydrolysing)